jgi:phosphatidylglycerophosphatase A
MAALSRFIATFFFIGYFPYLPGTVASLVALFLVYLLRTCHPICLIVVALVLLALGFIFAGKAERVIGMKDPPCIVIDEAAGMLLSFIFIPISLPVMLLGFVLFRVFDIFKPYPAGALQELRGSAGIMCDDIAAALYTNIILQLVLRVILS